MIPTNATGKQRTASARPRKRKRRATESFGAGSLRNGQSWQRRPHSPRAGLDLDQDGDRHRRRRLRRVSRNPLYFALSIVLCVVAATFVALLVAPYPRYQRVLNHPSTRPTAQVATIPRSPRCLQWVIRVRTLIVFERLSCSAMSRRSSRPTTSRGVRCAPWRTNIGSKLNAWSVSSPRRGVELQLCDARGTSRWLPALSWMLRPRGDLRRIKAARKGTLSRTVVVVAIFLGIAVGVAVFSMLKP